MFRSDIMSLESHQLKSNLKILGHNVRMGRKTSCLLVAGCDNCCVNCGYTNLMSKDIQRKTNIMSKDIQRSG